MSDVEDRRSVSFEVGLLYRNRYRGALDAIVWDEQADGFEEHKGWLTSTFSVKNISKAGRNQLTFLSRLLAREESAS